MKKNALCLILLLSVNFSFTQTVTLRVANLKEKKATLSFLSGEKISFIDSISANNNNEFELSLENMHSGVYRLKINQKGWLDFVHDKEDIIIETDADNILDSLKILKSESNKIYYEFINRNKNYKAKSELLQLVLNRYPEEDNYYQTTKEKIIKIQEDYLYFVNITAQSNPNSFIARYVRSAQLPVVDVSIPFDEQLTYLKTHALDEIDFYDDGLIYSDTFTNKSIEYLTYYRNPQLPLELLEKEFISAIDTILGKAKVNEIVYTHIIEYLLDGFKKFGFDNVINYIVENYVIKDDICLDESLSTALDRRIQQARNFKIGNVVPDIVMQNEVGKEIKLSSLSSYKILLVFYSTTCPHCTRLLPELSIFYKTKSNNEFEVLAISLDEDKIAWQRYIKNNKFDWINVNDTNSWNSKTVQDYYIYATPTMFLVDSEKKIIDIPKNIEEMK